MKKSTKNKKEILYAFIITLLMIAGSMEQKIPTETTEETEDLIRWKQEVSIEEYEVETVKQATEAAMYFDVPLSHELQDFIFEECEAHNIAPEIIISMIEQESNYKADAIGDNGNSLGLMQIQPKWHQERMERLECNDLLDPYQNIKVGIDYLSEIKDEYTEIEMSLMVYNAGESGANRLWFENGIYSSNYSKKVMEICQRLNAEQ